MSLHTYACPHFANSDTSLVVKVQLKGTRAVGSFSVASRKACNIFTGMRDCSGTNVMIVKIFPPKNAVKMYVCILCHKIILTLVLKKKRHFFTKIGNNRQK
jgi:hypothetical protein